MFLLVLYVFDSIRIKECVSVKEAQKQLNEWTEELESSFPHRIFRYMIYHVDSTVISCEGGLKPKEEDSKDVNPGNKVIQFKRDAVEPTK